MSPPALVKVLTNTDASPGVKTSEVTKVEISSVTLSSPIWSSCDWRAVACALSGALSLNLSCIPTANASIYLSRTCPRPEPNGLIFSRKSAPETWS